MNTTTIPASGSLTSDTIETLVESAVSLQREGISRWSDMCQTFLDGERKAMMNGQLSTPTEQRPHRRVLGVLLRFGSVYQAMMDPEMFDHRTRSVVSGRMWQLQESWTSLYGPQMTEDEADTVLRQAFGDDK